jgi:hypothetical protein
LSQYRRSTNTALREASREPVATSIEKRSAVATRANDTLIRLCAERLGNPFPFVRGSRRMLT